MRKLKDSGDPKITPTNANRIRAMTDEELAELFCGMTYCQECPHRDSCDKQAGEGYLPWLRRPAELGG